MRNKHIIIWAAWLIIMPSVLFYVSQTWPPEVEVNLLDVISFAVLICAISMFPIIINGTPIFFVQALSFVVFLYYGLFVEIILTQLSIIALLIKLKINRENSFRYPLNMLMFLVISLIGAATYKLMGGVNGEQALDSSGNIMALAGYLIAVTISNQLLLYIIKRVLYNSKDKLFDKGLLWELGTTAVVLPIGVILYLSYIDVGLFAIYFVGIPLISMSFILRLYYHSQRVNHFLKETGKIGNNLTRKMEKDNVIDLFITGLKDLLQADYVLIFEVSEEESLKMVRFYDVEHKLDFPVNDKLNKGESISGMVWETQQGIHYNKKNQWRQRKDHLLKTDGESVMSIPLEVDDQIVGVITVISKEKFAFEKYQYMLLEILTNYLAVALVNANSYESTLRQSERDPLTKLYNYRYLESSLDTLALDVDSVFENSSLSLIMLDLDHFKKVNDTYGHEAGNEILQELARRMESAVGNDGLTARYGGEEFSILLPGYSAEKAIELAEKIRDVIANRPFVIHEHILKEQTPKQVNLTASIGVAALPDHAETPRELIRLADRAMYLGAKKMGRNRVALYGEAEGGVG